MACHKIYDWYNVFLCDCCKYFIRIWKNGMEWSIENCENQYTYKRIVYMTMNGMILIKKNVRITHIENTSIYHHFCFVHSYSPFVYIDRVSCESLLLLLLLLLLSSFCLNINRILMQSKCMALKRKKRTQNRYTHHKVYDYI